MLLATAVGSSFLLWNILPVLMDLGRPLTADAGPSSRLECRRLLLPLVALSRRLVGGMIELERFDLPLELYRCAVAVACCILVVDADLERFFVEEGLEPFGSQSCRDLDILLSLCRLLLLLDVWFFGLRTPEPTIFLLH